MITTVVFVSMTELKLDPLIRTIEINVQFILMDMVTIVKVIPLIEGRVLGFIAMMTTARPLITMKSTFLKTPHAFFNANCIRITDALSKVLPPKIGHDEVRL